jgi:hypothetical protein
VSIPPWIVRVLGFGILLSLLEVRVGSGKFDVHKLFCSWGG